MADKPRHIAYIALGANLGDRAHNLRRGLAILSKHPDIEVIQVSSFLENPSIGGPIDAPPFLNAAAELRTPLSPLDLLKILLSIEQQLGRVRTSKNEPRPLDLDLLLYDNLIAQKPDLLIPHPRMHERRFVLAPMSQIAPDVVHPAIGLSMRDLLAQLEVES